MGEIRIKLKRQIKVGYKAIFFTFIGYVALALYIVFWAQVKS